MLRDSEGRQFFGFCGVRVYVPDADPRAESIADAVLRRFRERLQEALKTPPDDKPANVEGKRQQKAVRFDPQVRFNWWVNKE